MANGSSNQPDLPAGHRLVACSRPRAMIHGMIGFTAVSLVAFSVWAFAGRWLSRRVGEIGLYGVTALVFVTFAGLVLHPLIVGPRRLVRFHSVFVPAFLAYAVTWSLAWFVFGGRLGEWLGSFLGSVAFAAFCGLPLGTLHRTARVVAVVFLAHSAGYFLGGEAYAWLARGAAGGSIGLSKSVVSALAKLSWGLCYGLGFGAGIGFAFFEFQRAAREMESQT